MSLPLLGMLTSFFADGGRVTDKPYIDFNVVSGIPPIPKPPPFMSFAHGGRVGYNGSDLNYAGTLDGHSGNIIVTTNSALAASNAVTMQHMNTPSNPIK